MGCDALPKSLPVFCQEDFRSPSGMTKPRTLCIFYTVRIKAQPLAPSRACSRRSAALGLERLNEAHYPTTLGRICFFKQIEPS